MAFRVLAPCINVSDANGTIHHVYAGRVIRFFKDVERDHHLRRGLVEEVPDPVVPGVVDDATPPQPVSTAPAVAERPAATAPKDKWVGYVVSSGAATQAEAEQLTRDQLIALVTS